MASILRALSLCLSPSTKVVAGRGGGAIENAIDVQRGLAATGIADATAATEINAANNRKKEKREKERTRAWRYSADRKNTRSAPGHRRREYQRDALVSPLASLSTHSAPLQLRWYTWLAIARNACAVEARSRQWNALATTTNWWRREYIFLLSVCVALRLYRATLHARMLDLPYSERWRRNVVDLMPPNCQQHGGKRLMLGAQ